MLMVIMINIILILTIVLMAFDGSHHEPLDFEALQGILPGAPWPWAGSLEAQRAR